MAKLCYVNSTVKYVHKSDCRTSWERTTKIPSESVRCPACDRVLKTEVYVCRDNHAHIRHDIPRHIPRWKWARPILKTLRL